MGSIVNILQGQKDSRVLEGRAEIVQVLEYRGDGLYLIECVFVGDPARKVVTREYNIDEPMPGQALKVDRNPPPPLAEDVRTGFLAWFMTLNRRDGK